MGARRTQVWARTQNPLFYRNGWRFQCRDAEELLQALSQILVLDIRCRRTASSKMETCRTVSPSRERLHRDLECRPDERWRGAGELLCRQECAASCPSCPHRTCHSAVSCSAGSAPCLTLEEWSKAAPNVEIKLTEDPKHQRPYRNGVLQ